MFDIPESQVMPIRRHARYINYVLKKLKQLNLDAIVGPGFIEVVSTDDPENCLITVYNARELYLFIKGVEQQLTTYLN